MATLREVARRADVSLATAGRVLRGDPTLRVRIETRERVRAAAEALRYRPNRLASGLRMRRSGTIAVFLPDPRNLGWGPMLDGIEHAADEASHLVALSDVRGPALEPEVFARYALEGRVDGALVAPSLLTDELLERLAATGMVIVSLNGRTRVIPGSVTMRDAAGTRSAVEHLVQLGHRRIGHVTGDRRADVAARREEGFRDALREAGIRIGPDWVARGEYTADGGRGAAAQLFGMPLDRRPTAVVATNLTVALGVLDALRVLGLHVPTDVSLVTFDDHPIEDHLDPPLTAIRMPMTAMGAAAARMLLGGLAGEPVSHLVVPDEPQLVLRASTAPPARPHP